MGPEAPAKVRSGHLWLISFFSVRISGADCISALMSRAFFVPSGPLCFTDPGQTGIILGRY